MDDHQEVSKYARKAAILGEILANYRKEKQVILAKNPYEFKKILEERSSLIEALRALGGTEPFPSSPFLRLQKKHLDRLILEIQQERNGGSNFFPQ